MELAITETLAFTMADDGLGIVDDATVAVDDGELVYVGPTEGFDGDPDRLLDGSGTLTLPGLVDVHAHTGLTLARGAAQDVPEIEWMNLALGPLSEAMTPDDRIAGARLGVLESVRSGVTTLGEYAEDVGTLIEEAHLPLGLRVVATERINAVGEARDDLGPDEPYPLSEAEGYAELARAEALFDAYADHPRVTPMYGPQALDMVPPAVLEEIRDRATEGGRDVHMHVAQGDRERRQIEARYGAGESTVSVLEELGLVSERLLGAHLHGATVAERRRLADAGVRMAACPGSIAAIDGVMPPIVEYREAGGVAGIGTDQAPGPGGHDFLRSLRTAALLAKVDRGDPTATTAGELLRIGTIEGARALGIDDRVGSLEVGKRADLAVLDLETPATAPTVSDPLHTAVANVVYGATGGPVRTVLVDGEPVVDGGELATADGAAIVETAGERAAELFERAGERWLEAGSELATRARARR